MSGRLRDDVEYSAMDDEKQADDAEERSSYYGGASIPFIWESRPGTPKQDHLSDSFLPRPLTPPPTYYSSGILATPKRQSKVRTKLSKFLLMSMFNDLRKNSNSSKKMAKKVYGSTFSWSSTSSSSSFSSSSQHSATKPVNREKMSQVLHVKCEEDDLRSSPTLTLCFSNGGRKGFSSSMESKKSSVFCS